MNGFLLEGCERGADEPLRAKPVGTCHAVDWEEGVKNVNLERPPKHPMHSGVNHSPGCWVASLTTSPSDGVVNNCGNAASQGSAGVAGWVRSRISHFLTTKVGDGIRSSWAAPTQS